MTKTKSNLPHNIVVIQAANPVGQIRSIDLTPVRKKPQALTVGDAIHQWTMWMRKSAINNTTSQCIAYIGIWARDMKLANRTVASIQEDDINKWVNADDGTKRSTRTVRLSIVRSFFKYLAIKELLTAPNPSMLARVDFSKLSHKQKEAHELKSFTSDEFEKLLDYLSKETVRYDARVTSAKSNVTKQKALKKLENFTFWRAAAIISRCSGLRMGDICQLEWDCLGKKFTVWTDKRNRRVQPHIWNKPLFDATVKEIPKLHPQYCFPRRRLESIDPNQRGGLSMQFSRICKRLGFEDLTFHSLRGAYATECFKEGISMPHISMSMGHSSGRTTAGYIN